MRGSKNLSFCWAWWCMPAQKTVTNPKPEQNKQKQNNWKFRINVWTLLIGHSKSDFGLRET